MPATLKCDTITNASNAGTANLSLDASGNATVGDTLAMGSSFLRNRIINGDMRIDQRNAGASVTPASGAYTLDRWQTVSSQASKFSVQQNAGSVTPPTGFTNYFGVTSLSSYTVGSSELFNFLQNIEGYNIADLGWGTANAKTVTLSFWVRSSLTGTFGGAFNNGGSRSYPFSYTISSANTWEQKFITVAGDTTGTWGTSNSNGIQIWFSLGCGTSQSGTAGAWAAANYVSATGATSVVGTNGATFYITGVQLEVGFIATPFERRLYGQELALCQRYYYRMTSLTVYAPIGVGRAWSTSNGNAGVYLPVPMRTSPTLNYSSLSHIDIPGVTGNPTAISNDGCTSQVVKVGWARTGVTTGTIYQIEFSNGTGYWLDFSSEL